VLAPQQPDIDNNKKLSRNIQAVFSIFPLLFSYVPVKCMMSFTDLVKQINHIEGRYDDDAEN
jgi:hypothetical protein